MFRAGFSWSSDGDLGAVSRVVGEVAVGIAGVRPAFGMAAGVIALAQRRQILEIGGAAIFGGDEVVAFHELGGAAAAVHDAAAVHGQEGESPRVGGGAAASAEVEDLPGAAHHGGENVGVTRQAA